jgi:hypothetical protein
MNTLRIEFYLWGTGSLKIALSPNNSSKLFKIYLYNLPNSLEIYMSPNGSGSRITEYNFNL